ncbi:hypothetical protein AB9X29_004009 [Vibrio vulnificus]
MDQTKKYYYPITTPSRPINFKNKLPTKITYINYLIFPLIYGIEFEYILNAEESPDDLDKNHQVKVDAHLVM